MKQLCFCGSFTAGGTEKVTFELANQLCNEYEIHIMNMSDSLPTFFLNQEKIVYAFIGGSSLFEKIKSIRKYLIHNHIRLVISIEAMVGIFTIPATLGLRCQNIVWEHANYYQTQNSRWVRWIRKIWMIWADHYVVITKRDLGNFIKNECIRCPIDYVYNPLHLKDMHQFYTPQNKIIVSAGHIRPIKNFIIIPEIFAPIIKVHPDWKWYIYGDGSQSDILNLRYYIGKYNLENNVILKGRTNDMEKVYQYSSIYCLTSFQEGLPTVLLEAQSHGVPCVSFDIETGPDEIIINQKTGFLIRAYDKEDMRDKLLQLIENPQMCRSFSYNCAEVLDRFCYPKQLNKWKRIIAQHI